MILPTKHMSENRSLLGVGALILNQLKKTKTISHLWDDIKTIKKDTPSFSSLTYDGFILALDFLFLINAIEFENSRIRRVRK